MVVWLGAQAQAADPCGEKGDLEYAGIVDGAIQLRWTGQIANKMDIKLFESFSEHQDKAREIVLSLDSCGGHSPMCPGRVQPTFARDRPGRKPLDRR